MKENLLKRACQQVLCEELGFDEGKAYYLMLTEKEKELEKIFSYSKKYRVLKNLFKQGALGKLKSRDKDFFSYFLLPPSFLDNKKIDEEVINFLETEYFKQKSQIFTQDFIQLIIKDDESLIFFLLKHLMKKGAKIEGEKINPGDIELLGRKIKFKKNDKNKRKGIIDERLTFEFSQIKDRGGFDYIGYIENKV